MADEFVYPKRPKFFAHKFCRVLWKSCAANEIGADACWLLVGIAMTEDARGYRSPVTYFNEQLYPVAGQQNVKGMVRARDRAVAAGWLAYRPGGKGVAGKYFVTLPPEHGDWDDLPTDEGCVSFPDTTPILSKEAGEKREGSGVRSGREVGSQTGEKRERSGNHSYLVLSPIPSPIPNTPLPPVPGGDSVCEKPKRRARKQPPTEDDAEWSAEVVPLPNADPAFASAWSDWAAFLKSARKPMTNRKARLSLKKLKDAGLSLAEATACVFESASNEWQGIFVEKILARRTNGRQAVQNLSPPPPPPSIYPRITGYEEPPPQPPCTDPMILAARAERLARQAAAKAEAEESAA